MYQISAVIPAYNRARLLPRAIESVMNQVVPPAEIIVVDDGSTDNTPEVLAGYGKRIITIRQENGGSASARQRGLLLAQHDWVAFLDSDDIWLPDHLQRMVRAISSTAGKACYYFSDIERPGQNGENYRLWEKNKFAISGPYQVIDDATDVVLRHGLREPMMIQASVLNRQAAIACGGFVAELRYRDETNLFTKMGLEGAICAVSGVGAIMTADDDPDNRLTEQYNNSREGVRMQVVMFQDLLTYFGKRLTGKQRQFIRSKLSAAHWQLALIDLRSHALSSSMRHLYRAFRSDSGYVLGKVARVRRIQGASL